MPRAKADPDAPKPDKHKWTDSQVHFVLNEFLTEKEAGNMIGKSWKPVAFTNVLNRYIQAYKKPGDTQDPIGREQIKNMYSAKKSLYNSARRLKGISGIGWIEGECRIDMPAEWWKGDGQREKDAEKFRHKSFIFYNEMDELLHETRPAGALRTGTSSSKRVKAKKTGDVEDVVVENDDDQESVDADGLTRAERALDDGSQDGEPTEVEVVKKTVGLKSDDSLLPVIHSKSTESTKSKTTSTSTAPSTRTVPSNPHDDDDSENSKGSDVENKPSGSKKRKKMPARQVKPGTLANAIASASKDSVERSSQQISSKASRSADRDASLTEAARIRSERHPHQKEAIAIFNLECEDRFPNDEDRLIAIDVLAEEREAALFVRLEKMRWTWLERQVSKQKKLME